MRRPTDGSLAIAVPERHGEPAQSLVILKQASSCAHGRSGLCMHQREKWYGPQRLEQALENYALPVLGRLAGMEAG